MLFNWSKNFFYFLLLFFIFNSIQSKTIRRIFSKTDEELQSFAHKSLLQSLIDRSSIENEEISRLHSSINVEKNRQIFTIEFQLKLSSNEYYRCPISIYTDEQSGIRALLRSIICIRISSIYLQNENLQRKSFPIRIGDEISIDETDGFIDEENEQFDRHLFSTFEQIHQKIYFNDQQRENKYQIFKENLNQIDRLNIEDNGTALYGITQFTDLTQNEFSLLYLNEYLQSSLSNIQENNQQFKDPLKVSPDEFDWRNFNAITPVKNQGQCGSCWAFSVTGNIEGIWKIHSGNLISLSEQELIDCDKIDQGCNGGYMTTAFDQIIQMKGLMSEDDYKYEGKQHQQCQLDQKKIKVQINSYLNISSDENEMAEWLSQNGPISIGLNANMMQFYFRGVAHPHRSFCNPQGINHGVLLVGYGIEHKGSKIIPYWIIKNSWGSHWGEQGYYRLYRGDGSCGVNLMCSSALIN